MLVLDEREADVALTSGPKPMPGLTATLALRRGGRSALPISTVKTRELRSGVKEELVRFDIDPLVLDGAVEAGSPAERLHGYGHPSSRRGTPTASAGSGVVQGTHALSDLVPTNRDQLPKLALTRFL